MEPNMDGAQEQLNKKDAQQNHNNSLPLDKGSDNLKITLDKLSTIYPKTFPKDQILPLKKRIFYDILADKKLNG